MTIFWVHGWSGVSLAGAGGGFALAGGVLVRPVLVRPVLVRPVLVRPVLARLPAGPVPVSRPGFPVIRLCVLIAS